MEITLKQLDEEIAKLEALKMDYAAKKEESNRADALVKEQTNHILELLEKCGKSSYSVDGLGKVSVKETWAVTTPKGLEEKQAFFTWLKDSYGDDGFYTYATVNYQQLNSLYNRVSEENEAVGKNVEIPGLELPTLVKSLSFRRSK
jgi:hypothetical protein